MHGWWTEGSGRRCSGAARPGSRCGLFDSHPGICLTRYPLTDRDCSKFLGAVISNLVEVNGDVEVARAAVDHVLEHWEESIELLRPLPLTAPVAVVGSTELFRGDDGGNLPRLDPVVASPLPVLEAVTVLSGLVAGLCQLAEPTTVQRALAWWSRIDDFWDMLQAAAQQSTNRAAVNELPS